jgi:adenylate cyclase class 2
MNINNQEIEVKFGVRNLQAIQQRLEAQGADLTNARVHEINLRFDLPDGSLTRAHRVLRLRLDTKAILTYKGSAAPDQPVSVRQEIEVEVSNFENTRALLEALGYSVSFKYEKYRTTYAFQNTTVVLDELPYGHFVEIEGSDAENIQAAARSLNLDWNSRVLESYYGLFLRLKAEKKLSARNLSEAELGVGTYTLADLGIRPAD